MSDADDVQDSVPALAAEPPLITEENANDYPGPLFNRTLIEYFQLNNDRWDGIVQRAAMWNFYRERVPSLPKIEELTVFDIPAIRAVQHIQEGQTWTDFAKSCNLRLEKRNDEVNPWLAAWILKTPNNPHSWLRSIANTPLETNENLQARFTSMLKDVSPFAAGLGMGAAHAAIGTPPTNDDKTFEEIIRKFAEMNRFWLITLGGDHNDIEFRFGQTFCLLAGLGFNAIRIIAETLAKHYDGWDYWASATDKQLFESMMKARTIHGYPFGLLRLDAPKLVRWLTAEQIAPGDWLKPLIVLHVLKYARFTYKTVDSERVPAIQIIRDGSRSIIPLPRAAVKQTFACGLNKNLKADLLKSLGLPVSIPRGRNAFSEVAMMVHDVIDRLCPNSICLLRRFDDRIDLAVARSVQLIPVARDQTEYQFIDPGMGVTNVATIDYESGDVVQHDYITGADVGAIQWPEGEFDEGELATWRSCLPTKVEPKWPSETVFSLIRNVNDLGHPRAMRAVFDAFIMLGLFRHKMYGSAMGNTVVNEFPLGMIMPMGATAEETTNQGKTNLGRIMINTYSPGVDVTVFLRSSSPPTQRAMASPLEQYGTALYDEFQLPASNEHFLSKAGIQTLATGGTATPGRANENAQPMKLRHSMIFSTKVLACPPDIQNRSVFFFMDKLTDETRGTDEEYRIISTMIASNMVRMNAIALANRINFVQSIRTLTPKSNPERCRFGAFLVMATAFCMARGGTEKEVFAYFDACQAQVSSQRSRASESGLADEIGANVEFDPAYYLANCTTYTRDQLARPERNHTATDFLKEMIEDQTLRRFSDVLREYHIRESTAVARLRAAIKAGKMEHEGWRVETFEPNAKARAEEGRKYYRMVSPNPIPTIEDLEKQAKKDITKELNEAAKTPEKFASDKPSAK